MDPQTPQPPQVQNEQPTQVADVMGQIVGAIQNGKNVLVTVGADPTVDELASALGLTFLLGKLDKHATAVFSGKIPPAMEFLDPEKTFENTVDSLRDFIIALDKEKADKLRYKVEDEVVKIFITPYRTVLSEKDLEFSQGDFNVDVVIALGVEKREELDKAITSHGRILHDATVITINAGGKASSLGSIDWSDPAASSTAEMLVGLSEVLGSDLLDGQISTAFLTGIVAETNRFSNDKTSPRVMNLSAQLMAAGANQQLIASNLRQEGMISEPVRKKEANQPHDDDGELALDHGEKDEADSDKKNDAVEKEQVDPKQKKPVKTSKQSKKSEDEKPVAEPVVESPVEDKSAAKPEEPTAQLKQALKKAAEPAEDNSSQNDDDTPQTPANTGADEEQNKPGEPPVSPEEPNKSTTPRKVIEPLASADEPKTQVEPAASHLPTGKPTFGGTLNATTAEAEEEKTQQAEREAEANNVALTHAESDAALEEARKAVEDANLAQPFNPANQPLQAINTEPLPSVEPATTPDASVAALQSAPVAPPEPVSTTEEKDPVEAFMQPHTDGAGPGLPALNTPTPISAPLPSVAATGAADSGLPPLPPLPGTSGDPTGLPPLPPMPGQPVDPAAAVQPQINPGFMQDMPQSQNSWTQAGDDVAAKQADADAVRQQKMDQMTQQYDQAVDRNREMQGLPPVNNPNGSGLPPLPPLNP